MEYHTSQSITILIVDDTPKNIQVIGTILEEKGYKINVALNGLQAIKTAEEIKPDLILLDIIMPKMDGFETCVRLKSLDSTKDIPVIFLTAKAESENIIKGFKTGGVDYITKPFNREELLARIGTHLELRESRKIIETISNERKELLHVLCHDLAVPFLSLKSLLMVEKDAPEMFDKNKDKYFYHIGTTIDNSLNLIEQIRILCDTENPSVSIKEENLLSMVQQAEFLLKDRLRKKNIIIKTKISKTLNIYCDKAAFTNSVLLNILTNAVKFSHRNSIIEISAINTVDITTITIRDYGIGIPEKIMNTLRSDSVTNNDIHRKGTEGEDGNGVGMSLVKKFISLYSGKIAIESKIQKDYPSDHGTAIIITLRKTGV